MPASKYGKITLSARIDWGKQGDYHEATDEIPRICGDARSRPDLLGGLSGFAGVCRDNDKSYGDGGYGDCSEYAVPADAAGNDGN